MTGKQNRFFGQYCYPILSFVLFALGLFLALRSSLIFPDFGSDFVQDYVAGHALRQGVSLYGDAFQSLVQTTTGLSEFRSYHPPWSALLFVPFSFLPHAVSFGLWNAFSTALYLWLAWLGARFFEPRFRLPIIGASLLWYPFIYGIGTGQSSILIAACLWAGYLQQQKSRPILAGAFFGVAATIKLFPLLVVWPLLWTRSWKALLTLLLVLGVSICGSLLLGAPGDVDHYLRIVMRDDVNDYGTFLLNCSLSGLILPLLKSNGWTAHLIDLPDSAIPPLSSAIGLTGLVLYLLGLRRLRATKNGDRIWALTLGAMILISPISWLHIFPALLPILLQLTADPSTRALRILGISGLLCAAIPDVTIARALVAEFGATKLPVLAFFAFKLPTWWLLSYCRGIGNSPTQKDSATP